MGSVTDVAGHRETTPLAAIGARAGKVAQEHPLLARGVAVLTVGLLVTFAYVGLCRPYQLHLGATAAEVERPMPGDELNTNPSFLATRAITITGSPDEIWPWLLQMGYGRAGYYGYDLLENAGSPERLRSADEILPRFQDFVVGDEVPISAVVSMTFHTIEPNRHLIWLGDDVPDPGVFTWSLYPLDSGQTRLVSRIRWSYDLTSTRNLFLQLFTEFADHIAVRKILEGVKQRVEHDIEPFWVQNVEFTTFLCTFLIFLAALALLCWRRLTWRTWGAALFAGVVWLTNWYAPISMWLGALLALLATGTLLHAHLLARKGLTASSDPLGTRHEVL